MLDATTCSHQVRQISLHHRLEIIHRFNVLLHIWILKVVPEWLEDGLIVASPGTIRQINVMALARFVDFLPPVELPIVTTFVWSCRITTESKTHLVGHPCTCVGRRDNWLCICDKSIQGFNHLTRISAAICTHSCPSHDWFSRKLLWLGRNTCLRCCRSSHIS